MLHFSPLFAPATQAGRSEVCVKRNTLSLSSKARSVTGADGWLTPGQVLRMSVSDTSGSENVDLAAEIAHDRACPVRLNSPRNGQKHEHEFGTATVIT